MPFVSKSATECVLQSPLASSSSFPGSGSDCGKMEPLEKSPDGLRTAKFKVEASQRGRDRNAGFRESSAQVQSQRR